jgi:hypothetical protein
MRAAAIRVEPDPPNRSSTFSPRLEEEVIASSASSTGFPVRRTIDGGATFFTLHSSVAFLISEST